MHNTLLVIQKQDGKGLAKFQFDHFYPKDKYPYFSLSLYNLIPSCANCNHRKRNTEMDIRKHFHPFYNSVDIFGRFKIIYPPSAKLDEHQNLREIDLDQIKLAFCLVIS